MATYKTWYLECKNVHSNKFYWIRLISEEHGRASRYRVETSYGAIGNTPKRGKGGTFYSEYRANEFISKLLSEKKNKGYRLKSEEKPKKANESKKDKEVKKSLGRFSNILIG